MLPGFKNPDEIIVKGKAMLDGFVICEYTVKQPLPTRQGMVGPQADYFKNTQGQTIQTGQTYPGGGNR